MKDLTPQQEAERLHNWFYKETELYYYQSKSSSKFTAQQIADNTTGATKIFYLEVIKEIEKL
jgi:hypothetical protein